MQSSNQGNDWKAISEDLTKGPRKGNVAYGTITTISESNLKEGLIYVGSDDGEISVTKNKGKKWTKIVNTLPENLWVSRVVASRHLKNRVYTTLNGYRYDNFKPFVYISEDYGTTWKDIGKNLPNYSVNVIKEDLNDENILYVGADNGLFISFNKGDSWSAFNKGLPKVAVHDLVIQPQTNDLIVATHGRSLYKTNVAVFEEYQNFKNNALYIHSIQNIKYNSSWGNSWSKWLKAYEPLLSVQVYSKSKINGEIVIVSENGNTVYKNKIKLEAGFNSVNYNLTIKEKEKLNLEKNNEDLLIPKKKNGNYYLPKGNYEVKIATQNTSIKTNLIVE